MSGRPAKLQPSATLVVWGCAALTLGEKVVWYHDWALDQGGPDGCYASHRAMSHRVGGSLTEGTISKTRQRLKRLTLHLAVQRPDARNLGWVSTLPAPCIPRAHREAPALAVALEHYLRDLAGWRDGLDRMDRTVQPERTVQSRHNEGTAAALGGIGGAPFSASESEAQLPSVVREKRVGAFARKGEKGGDDIQRPMSADERAAFEVSLAKMPARQAAMLRRIAGAA